MKKQMETKQPFYFDESELEQFEQMNTEGVSLSQIIDLLANRGIHLSEATFRKYVQLGLLTRSNRVGRKGKHRGSLGLYPPTTVRRLNTIRQMMDAQYTVEEIQRSFLRFTNHLDNVQRQTTLLLNEFESELQTQTISTSQRKALLLELQTLKKDSAQWLQRMEKLEQQLVSPQQRVARQRAFQQGSAMGAVDLL